MDELILVKKVDVYIVFCAVVAMFVLGITIIVENHALKQQQYDFSCNGGCEIMDTGKLEPIDVVTRDKPV